MKSVFRTVSYAGLVLSLLPALLLFAGAIGRPAYQVCMIVGMILWFGGAVLWIKAPRAGE